MPFSSLGLKNENCHKLQLAATVALEERKSLSFNILAELPLRSSRLAALPSEDLMVRVVRGGLLHLVARLSQVQFVSLFVCLSNFAQLPNSSSFWSFGFM